MEHRFIYDILFIFPCQEKFQSSNIELKVLNANYQGAFNSGAND